MREYHREDSLKTHHIQRYARGRHGQHPQETALGSQKQHLSPESASALLLPEEHVGQSSSPFSAFLEFKIGDSFSSKNYTLIELE